MLYAIVAVIILILDQGLKYWTSLNIAYSVGRKPIIPGIVHLTNYHNTGAAFSFLEGARWFFVIITVIFVIAVIVLLSMEIISGKFGRWAAVLVLAGAIGNGIDRVLYGYVVDMIEVEFITFPIFNIADIFVTVGGILFCLYVLLHKPDAPAEPAPEKEGAKPKKALGKTFASLLRSSDDKAEPEAENIVPERKARIVRSERPEKAQSKADAEQPLKAQRPARPEPKPIDPADPFAEWESRDITPVPEIDADDIAVFTIPETPSFPAPSAPEPTVSQSVPAAEEKASPAADDELEFSLEDILAEFGKGE